MLKAVLTKRVTSKTFRLCGRLGFKLMKKSIKGLRFTPTGSGFYPPIVKMFYNKDGEKYTKDVEKSEKNFLMKQVLKILTETD